SYEVETGTRAAGPPRRLDKDLASTELEDAARNIQPTETARDAELTFRPVTRAGAPYRFQTLKRWEGVVVAMNADDFAARLHNLDNPSEYHLEAVIPVEEITDSDRDLLQVGAVFYWTIGYRTEVYGQKSSVSTIRFRRLPVWTSQDRQRLS